MGSKREELTGLTVWSLEPIPPGSSRRVVVELNAAESEARGTYTLKLWAEAAGERGVTLDGFDFRQQQRRLALGLSRPDEQGLFGTTDMPVYVEEVGAREAVARRSEDHARVKANPGADWLAKHVNGDNGREQRPRETPR